MFSVSISLGLLILDVKCMEYYQFNRNHNDTQQCCPAGCYPCAQGPVPIQIPQPQPMPIPIIPVQAVYEPVRHDHPPLRAGRSGKRHGKREKYNLDYWDDDEYFGF